MATFSYPTALIHLGYEMLPVIWNYMPQKHESLSGHMKCWISNQKVFTIQLARHGRWCCGVMCDI